jgi:hypothetical protein
MDGRLVLINSVLSNMVLYMICFFQLPRGVAKRLDYFRSRFFWQDQGGHGIQNLEIKNRAILGK